MADAYEGPDGLHLYLCGGEAAAELGSHDASLGGVALAEELTPLVWRVIEAMPSLVLVQAGASGLGVGVLRAVDAYTLVYAGPGGGEGDPVVVDHGRTKVVRGADPEDWVRVYRPGTADLSGTMRVELVRARQNALAHRDPTSAERAAGLTTYRALMLRAHESVTAVALHIVGDGYSIAKETPGADGAIQLPAHETTAPTGMTWLSAGTGGPGLEVGALAAGEACGIRLRRVCPATVGVDLEAQLLVSWTAGGVDYTRTYWGCYSAPDDTLEGVVGWVGVDAAPDPTSAPTFEAAADTALVTLTPPASGLRTYNILTGRRNAFGLVSLNRDVRSFTIDEAGVLQVQRPDAPTDVSVRELPGGMVMISAFYGGLDADQWAVYATVGTDPEPGVDTPELIPMAGSGGASHYVTAPFGGPQRTLRTALGPYAWDTDLRVLVRTRRSSDDVESGNLDVTQLYLSLGDTVPPAHRQVLAGATAAIAQRAAFSTITTVAVSPEVLVRQLPGESQLWASGALVWRCRWGSKTTAGLYIPDLTFVEDLTEDFGAGTGPIDVVVEAGPTTVLYLVVAGRRRAKLNLAAGELRAASFAAPQESVDCPLAAPAWMGQYLTAFQVYSPVTGRCHSFLHVDTLSRLSSPVPVYYKRG